MHAVSAATSDGSTEGNTPMRSWLRPSLRYPDVSTMPFSRSAAMTCLALTASSRSTVTTALEREPGSATNGRAYSLRYAHSYSSAADCAQRAVDQAMPPFSLSQRT